MRKAKTRELLIRGNVTMMVIYGAGEPCAVKAARTVREGAVGKGLGTEPRLPPTSSQPDKLKEREKTSHLLKQCPGKRREKGVK